MEFHGRWQSGPAAVAGDRRPDARSGGSWASACSSSSSTSCRSPSSPWLLLHMYWPLGSGRRARRDPDHLADASGSSSKYVVVSRGSRTSRATSPPPSRRPRSAIRTVKSFGRSRLQQRRASTRRRATLYDTSMEKVRLSSRFWTFLEIIPNVSLVIVLLLGALAVGQGDAHARARWSRSSSCCCQLVWPIAALGVILAMAQEAMTAADRVHGHLRHQVRDRRRRPRAGRAPRGHLRFEHVDFAFPDCDELVLRDVNLEVLPGETVAIVGATGSGKTALTALVPRLYDVTAGRVTIDGVDVRDADAAVAAHGRRHRLRGADAVLDERPRERHARPARCQRRRHRRGDRDRAGRASSTSCRGVSTPGSASRACRCPAASASGSRWPAPCSPSRGSWCSTTRCRRSTSTPRRWSRRRCARCCATATGIVVAHRASTVMLADKVALLQRGTITHVGTPPRAAGDGARVPRPARSAMPTTSRSGAERRAGDARHDRDRQTGAASPPRTTTTCPTTGLAAAARALAPAARRACCGRTSGSSTWLLVGRR